MAKPETTETAPLHVYDTAVMDWLAGLLIDYGDVAGRELIRFPILRTMASPQKAFAEMYYVLQGQGFIEEATPGQTMDEAAKHKLVPLPFSTVQRGDYYIDEMRSNAPYIFHSFAPHPNDPRKRQDYPHPIPIKIPYTVFFWSKKRFTMDYMQEWVDTQFGRIGASPNEMFLKINHPLWGTQVHAWKKTGHYDSSRLEGVMWEFRDMMSYYDFELNGWLFLNPPVDDEGASPVIVQEMTAEDVRFASAPQLKEIETFYTTENLLFSLSSIYQTNVIFDTYNAEITVNDECFDARYNVLNTYRDGSEPAYKFEFTDTDGTVETKQFLLPTTSTVISNKYIYKCVTDIEFEILDENDKVSQHFTLNSGGVWDTIEILATQVNNYRLRWKADSGSIVVDKIELFVRGYFRGLVEHVIDSDMSDPGVSAWTALGGATLSKLFIGTDSYLHTTTSSNGDGVEQEVSLTSAIYLLTIQILNCTGDYEIFLIDPDTGVQDSIMVDSSFKEIGIVLSGLNRLKFRVVQNGSSGFIDLDNVQIRKFGAPVFNKFT